MPMRFRFSPQGAIDQWVRLVLARPYWTIAALLLLIALMSAQLGRLRLETNMLAYLPEQDSSRVLYDNFRRQFDEGDAILLLIEADDIFDLEFLSSLRDLHQQLEHSDIPYIKRVHSLLNARDVEATDDTIHINELFHRWPESPAELKQIKARALANPLLIKQYFSPDHRYAVILIEPVSILPTTAAMPQKATKFLSTKEETQLVEGVYAVTRAFTDRGLTIHATGGPVQGYEAALYFGKKAAMIALLADLLIGALVFALLRRWSAVFLSLLIAMITLLGAFSLMAILRHPMYSITQTLSPLLIAVSVAGTVHVLVTYYQRLPAAVSREQAIVDAIKRTGLPVLLAGITTAVGMASFMTSDVNPLRSLGTIAPLAIMVSVLLNLTLLPALMKILRVRSSVQRTDRLNGQWLVRISMISLRYPGRIIVTFVLLSAIALVGVKQTDFNLDPMKWFSEDNELRLTTELYDAQMHGYISFNVLVDTGVEGGVTNPEVLSRIDSAQDFLLNQQTSFEIGLTHATGINDLFKEINKALNGGDPRHYRIADSQEALAQQLLLYELSGESDLYRLIDENQPILRLVFTRPDSDIKETAQISEFLHNHLQTTLQAYGKVEVTGAQVIISQTIIYIMHTMFTSYSLALIVICLLMMLMLRSISMGLLAMIPNIVPVLFTLGLAGFLHIGFDLITITVGAVALGLAVDDTIHYFSSIRRLQAEGLGLEDSISETVRTTGRALLFTSLILSGSFVANLSAGIEPYNNYALLACAAIGFAFITDIVLTPALLKVAQPRESKQFDLAPAV